MRKFYVTMALSLVCALGLHADDQLYGVMLERGTVMKLYYDNERAIRGGTVDWITEYAEDAEIVSLDITLMDYKGNEIKFPNFKNLVYIEHLDFYQYRTGDTEDMFKNCEKLKWVDLSSFDLSPLCEGGIAFNMFSGCSSLETIYCDEDLSGERIRGARDMFTGCTSLKGSNGTEFDPSKNADQYARPDGGASSPGYFTPTSERIRCGLITMCELQGFKAGDLKPGDVWNQEVAERIGNAIKPVHADDPFALNSCNLFYFSKEDNDYLPVEDDTALEEGQYRLDFTIRTNEPAYKHGQRFPHPDEELQVEILLNDKPARQDFVNIYNDWSDCFAEFEFSVSREGVANIRSNKVQSTKFFRNGQLLIERNGKIFNAIGAEVQ